MKPSLVVLPMLVTACYTYAPARPQAVQPGDGVRARVTAATAERISPLLGISDARVLTGTLVDNNGGALVMEVPTIVQAGVGSSTESLHQRIAIQAGELVELETRKLDRGRTALVAGAAVLVGGSMAIAALRGSPGSERPPTGSSTDHRKPGIIIRF